MLRQGRGFPRGARTLELQALDQRAAEPHAGAHQSPAQCTCEQTAADRSALKRINHACMQAAAEVAVLQARHLQVKAHLIQAAS